MLQSCSSEEIGEPGKLTEPFSSQPQSHKPINNSESPGNRKRRATAFESGISPGLSAGRSRLVAGCYTLQNCCTLRHNRTDR
jgi:hypothetical protein